jgi:hypothetical protein
MNFTKLLASIKVKDILEGPPSPDDSEIITELRSNPPTTTASLFDFIVSKIQAPPVEAMAISSSQDLPRRNFSKTTSKINEEDSSSDTDSDIDSTDSSECDGSEESDGAPDEDCDSLSSRSDESEKNSSDDISNYSGAESVGKKTRQMGGRRSNEALKNSALMMPFFDVANCMALPCNTTCCLEKRCCAELKMETILNERVEFFNKVSEPGKSLCTLCIINIMMITRI